MSKKFVIALYFLTFTYQSQRKVDAAPFDNDDGNAIIIIPFKASTQQVVKIKSFKIDGQTAVKELITRVSAEKILRTLSNVPEFDILVEGLDAITLGDIYKAAFPSGILQSISEHFLRSPLLIDNDVGLVKPETVETTKTIEILSGDEKVDEGIASETEIPHDEVHEDDFEDNDEELKEEPITDDYVYDQPIEDRFYGEREYVTREDAESEKKVENEDTRDSKNLNLEKRPNEAVADEKVRKNEVSLYGAQFRNWITKFLTG
ncbi:uncharacterized protein LOC119082842 [Bradysia coprophila]|uniref:uncharacterized protein LOC119082842 n=1 Tax=Bradysia coprophila TaxID=38358 RepID=UPI00187D7745|nr:uncharacterized protein LOC119082842 [Bradysia coprophila]